MGSPSHKGSEYLPPPPPIIPPNVVPLQSGKVAAPAPKRLPMARRNHGTKGTPMTLLTNHFEVRMRQTEGYFCHYSVISLCSLSRVALFYEDGHPVDGKGIGRKILDKVQETYSHELEGKHFAYDGEKSLFTLGSFQRKKLEFTIVVEDLSSNRTARNDSPGGDGSPGEGDRKRMRRPSRSKVIRVEISYAAKIPMQAIANALRGQETEHFQEAMRVLDIILRQNAANQGCLLVRQSFFHNNPRNFADLGGGVMGCRGFHSSFRATQSGLSLNMDVSTTMIVKPGPVVNFLLANQNVREPHQIDWNKAKRVLKNLRINTNHSNTEYKITGLSDLPCNQQTFSLKQKSGHNGDSDAIEITVYEYFVNNRHIKLEYSADFPCINVGKPKRASYIPLELCTLVSLQRYTKALSNQQRASLVEKSRQKPQERMGALTEAMKRNNYGADQMLRSFGISIGSQFTQVEGRTLPAPRLKVGNGEDFFPRGGRWNFNNKKLVEPMQIKWWAIVNFSARCDIRSLCNNLIRCGEMKGMLGGMNSLLTLEHSRSIPLVSKPVTMILGMDVSHGSPGRSDLPSIAAVVSSRQWPSISRYRASVRTQSPKVEMIANLFKPGSETEDYGIISDGVSESQFNQVLNIELDQIIEASKFLDEKWSPKFTVIVAQKNHHTKFFQSGRPENVPPGTVVDKGVCHPRNNDFYLCAHAGMIGTSRPTHYHVLHDEIGFSADDLQELVHSLSYVYQRSTTAVSVVTPICYAHLAAAQMSQFIKFDEMSDTSSSHNAMTSAGSIPVPELPVLHERVCNSMFFC
ncbi:protein argonaute 4B [Citrus sinensis]|nr:protein argonaute 4B [Citrus sinensis]